MGASRIRSRQRVGAQCRSPSIFHVVQRFAVGRMERVRDLLPGIEILEQHGYTFMAVRVDQIPDKVACLRIKHADLIATAGNAVHVLYGQEITLPGRTGEPSFQLT